MSEPILRSQTQGEEAIRVGGSAIDDEASSRAIRNTAHHRIHDATRPARFRPKKLYGRSTEMATLLKAFRRMTDQAQENQRPELIVISGADGVGKSSLARTLKKQVTEEDGYFLRGKFDRLSARGEPFTAFIAAFTEFASQVTSRGSETRNAMKHDIQTAVPEDTCILIDMIPSLALILGSEEGKETTVVDSPARMRFTFVFRKFVRAVCSPQRPLIILLDDAHFADQSSLDLLSTLIPDASNEGIMFVVTCRDAQPESPLSKLLCRLEEARVAITRLRLLNLNDDIVNDIVGDVLDLPTPQTKHLTCFIYQETNGNVNFVLQFLNCLSEKNLLRFDDENMRWVVSEEGMYEEMESYNIGGLIIERMMKLPSPLLEVLKVASCLGSALDKLLLDRVFGTCVSRHLFLVSEFGFLVYDTQLEQYFFAHDAIQNAAYSLIPKDEKRFFHLSVGRKLRRNFSEYDFVRNIFVVMNQYRLGADRIESAEEKNAVAELCLQTAVKAVAASSFPTSSLYLELGIWLLGEDIWKDHYELGLALYSTAAEVNYCTADFERVRVLTAAVFDNASCFRHKLRAYTSEVFTLGAMDKMEDAMVLGLEVLRKLRTPVPIHPTARQVERETRKLRRATNAKTNEALLRLPLMKDADQLASLSMMGTLFLYAHLYRPQLAGILTLRMMQITLEGGLSAMSSSAFTLYGMLLCSSGRDADEGYRFGCLSLALLEKFKRFAPAWLPRVYAGQYGCISPWKRPFRESQEPLKRSVLIGLEYGDIEYSMLNASLYCFNLIDAGLSLPFIDRELQGFREVMTLQKQEGALTMVRSYSCFIRNLMGQEHDLVSATGQLCFDDTATLAPANAMNEMLGLCFHRAILAYLFTDYSLALKLMNSCQKLFQHPMAGFDLCAVAYWTALVSLALATTLAGRKKAGHVARSRQYMKMLKGWALDSPHNLMARVSLLQAEEASVTGNSKRAYAKYLIAISVAKEEQLLNEECIATERAARHMLRLNDFVNAAPLLRRSYQLYLEWGATVKAEHLKNEFSHCITD